MKRFYAFFIIVIATLFVSLPCISFADNMDSYELENKMNLLYELNIIPEIYTKEELSECVDRTETASVVAGMMNAHILSHGLGEHVLFTDVNPLSEGADYIAFVNDCGIMTGHDGKFYPERLITCEELIKVMTTVAGYDDYAKVNGGYPSGYMSAATRMDILNAISVGMGQTVTRYDLINISYETLMADALEINAVTPGGNDYVTGRSVLSVYFDAYKIEGIVNATSLTCLYDSTDDILSGNIVIGSTVVDAKEFDTDKYLGLPVIAYVKEESSASGLSLLAIEVDVSVLSKITIGYKDYGYITNDGECRYYAEDKEKNIRISQTANVIYNNRYAAKLYDCNPDLLKIENGFVEMIDANSDRIYETIIIKEPRIVLLEGGNALSEQLVTTDGMLIDISSVLRDYVLLECNGGIITPERIKRNTVAEIYESVDKKVISVVMTYKQVDGSITMVGDDTVAIDGTDYPASVSFIKETKLNSEGTFFFDSMGRVVMMDADKSNRKHYAVVVAVGKEGGLSNVYKLKLFDDTGIMKILEFNDKCVVDGEKIDVNNDLYLELTIGAYSVKNNIIRYVYNSENKIIWLDTLKPNILSEEDELVENYSGQSMVWKSKTSIFGESQIKIDGNNTPIFIVPYEGADDKRWRLRSTSEYKNDKKYTVSAYSLNDMLIPGALVQYEKISSSSSPAYDNFWFIYKGKSIKVNADGEPVTVIKGWFNGIEDATYIIPENYAWNEAQFGDVFQLSTNVLSEVTGYRLCHGANDKTFMRSDTIYSETVNGYIQTFGRVLRIQGTNVVVNVGSDDEPDERVYDLSIAKAGYVIDLGNETIRKAIIADIAPNSLILIRDRSREPTEYAIIH